MATAKTTKLIFRIEPELKEVLCTAAQQELWPITNMVAVLIRDNCKHNDILTSEVRTTMRWSKCA